MRRPHPAYLFAAALAAAAHAAFFALSWAGPEAVSRAAPPERGVQLELAAAPKPPAPHEPLAPAPPPKVQTKAALPRQNKKTPPPATAAPRPAEPAAAQAAPPSAPPPQSGVQLADSAPQSLGASVNPQPKYPRDLQKLGREGTVKLLVQVDEAGRVQAVEITQSSGYMPFDRSALAAVRKWRYTPARRFGKAVPGEAAETVIFRLGRAQK